MDAEQRCDLRAAAQHGVLSRAQALTEGMSERAIDRRVANGRWRVLFRGVYVPRAVPTTWHQRLMAAVLAGGSGALATHRSAAALWGIGDEREGLLEISVTTGRSIAGVKVHRRRDHPRRKEIAGIPVTGIERTVLDFAAVVSEERAGLALDDALRRRITTLARVGRLLGAEGGQGRRGSRTLRGLLELRDGRDAVLESRLEAAFLGLLRRREMPLPLAQHRVLERGVLVARLDFAYPLVRVGIEVDGYRWHTGPDRWRRDARRENRLKLSGWTVLRFSWEDVHERGDQVVAQIRSAIGGSRVG